MKKINAVTVMSAVAAALFTTTVAMAAGQTSLAHLHAGQPSSTPIGWVQFCTETPRECAVGPVQAETVKLTDGTLARNA